MRLTMGERQSQRRARRAQRSLPAARPEATVRQSRWPRIIGGIVGVLVLLGVVALMGAAGFELSGLAFQGPFGR